MALINKDSVLKDCLQALKKVEIQQGVELLSYKRNRTIAILRLDNDTFLIKENGYVVEELTTPFNKLSKLLKVRIKREFPRSRKVRLYRFSFPEQLERKRQKI